MALIPPLKAGVRAGRMYLFVLRNAYRLFYFPLYSPFYSLGHHWSGNVTFQMCACGVFGRCVGHSNAKHVVGERAPV